MSAGRGGTHRSSQTCYLLLEREGEVKGDGGNCVGTTSATATQLQQQMQISALLGAVEMLRGKEQLP